MVLLVDLMGGLADDIWQLCAPFHVSDRKIELYVLALALLQARLSKEWVVSRYYFNSMHVPLGPLPHFAALHCSISPR